MRISVTERQTYKRCRRKWNYTSNNRQSLSPMVNAPALDLGTVIHATLARWTDDPTADPNLIYTSIAQEYFQIIISTYRANVGCDPSEQELMPTMEAMQLGQYMIENYHKHWRTPIPPGYTLIQNELSLVQPVPGTEHCLNTCKCCYGIAGNCLPVANCCLDCVQLHELECTFDGVMADANGDLFIIERKTFSRTPSLDELQNNDQFLAYQWALAQVRPGQVAGVAYDGLLKKPTPSGVHRTVNDLFLRRILVRPQAELDEFGTYLAQELLEMANPSTPLYKAVPPVTGCQKWECAFLQVCHAQSRGEPTTDLLKMFTRSTRKQFLELET